MLYTLLIEKRNLNHAAAIHYTAEEELQLAMDCDIAAPPVVVPLGVDATIYERVPHERLLSGRFPEIVGKKVVLFLGRLNFKKGLDILAAAFDLVRKDRPDVHLVIAGPDNEGYAWRVEKWVSAAATAGAVTFTGMLEGDEKLAAFREAAVFVLPSYSENFGISVVEAMACGVPVIISDKVNIWREVRQSGAGMVTRCNAEEVAAAILEILADEQRARMMGCNGKDLVQKHYTWTAAAAAMEGVYQNIVESAAQRRAV